MAIKISRVTEEMLQSTRVHRDFLINEQREYLIALDEARVRLAKDLRRVSLFSPSSEQSHTLWLQRCSFSSIWLNII